MRNTVCSYDVGQGIDYKGQFKIWSVGNVLGSGGAAPAELAALTRFADDPAVSMVEEFAAL
jgi:hypothetical protein